MATQNFVLFHNAVAELANGEHDLTGDTFKVGLVTSSPTDSQGSTVWPGSFSQATLGGSYTADIDVDLTTGTAGGITTVTTGDLIVLAATDGSPTASHGVLYNATSGNKAVGYFALDNSPVDLTGNNLTVTLGDLFTLTV